MRSRQAPLEEKIQRNGGRAFFCRLIQGELKNYETQPETTECFETHSFQVVALCRDIPKPGNNHQGDGGTETSCLKGPWGSAPEPYTHTKD